MIINESNLSNIDIKSKIIKYLEYNIDAIIIINNNNLNNKSTSLQRTLSITINNKHPQNILQYFNECYNFIQSSIQKTNIAILNQIDTQYSISLIVAYMIKKYRYSYQIAQNIIKDKINKNNMDRQNKLDHNKPKNKSLLTDNLITQLKQYDKNVNKSSIKQKFKTQQSLYMALLDPINPTLTQNPYDKSIQLIKSKNKQSVQKHMQISKLNYSQMLRSKLDINNYKSNQKIVKKIDRLKTSIALSSRLYDKKEKRDEFKERDTFQQVLKSKIYGNTLKR